MISMSGSSRNGAHGSASPPRLAAQVGVIDEKLAASLAPTAGLRNVLVHAYLDVDHDLVAEATRLAPEQFGDYVRQAARWFAERSGAV